MDLIITTSINKKYAKIIYTEKENKMKQNTSVLSFFLNLIKKSLSMPVETMILLISISVQTCFSLILPITYKNIFDDAIQNDNISYLINLIAFAFFLYVSNGFAGVAQDFVTARIGSGIAVKIREDLFHHIQGQGPNFYEKFPDGDLSSGFGADVAAVELALMRSLPGIILRGATILLGVGLLFTIEWRLALATVGMMPIMFWGPRLFSAQSQKNGKNRDNYTAEMSTFVQENILANLFIRTFYLRNERCKKFLNIINELRLSAFRAHFMASLVRRSAVLTAGLLQIVVLGAGAWLAIHGYMTTGMLIAFIGLLLNIGTAVDQFTQAVPQLINSANAMNRINKIFDYNDELKISSRQIELKPLENEISLKQVYFGYSLDNLVLHDINILVPAGKMVAIVGGSGSGKSTILSLLTRLHHPLRGTVAYDGTDLRAAMEESFRQQTSVVLQNTILFDLSIRENIRMGRLDATDQEVEQAAQDARLHDMIVNLPDGYDTRVGSQGGMLSGGQRQRVAIARALLRRSSVLFLDEATSALDSVTETEINSTVKEAARGKTVVSVTHRLAHITDYDLIYVMDKGALVEAGAHHDLIKKDGIYAALWAKQGGFTIKDGAANITAKRLRDISFLADCADSVLDMLCDRLVSENVPAGRVLFHEGDPGDKFYIVARGKLESYVCWGDGREQVLSVMADGDWFGELALIKPFPRTCAVRTVADTTFLTLNRYDFMALMELDSNLSRLINDNAHKRMKALGDAIIDSV